jgi:hypothetical protein
MTVKSESVCFMKAANQSGFNTKRYAGPGQGLNRRSHKSREMQKGTNPLDEYGNRTRCAICGSIFHWAKDCPHKEEAHACTCDDQDEHNITLFVKGVDPCEVFMCEAFSTAVVDTACTKTVCGEDWLDNYINILDEDQRSCVKIRSSDRMFRFGDGQKVKSMKQVTIPAQIGNTKCNIEAEVVKSKIPLSLSKNSWKKAKTVLDMNNDTAQMFDQPVELFQTYTGHYCINMVNPDMKEKFVTNHELIEGESNGVMVIREAVERRREGP